MLELGVGADLLRAAGWLYLSVAAAALAFALWLPKAWWLKALAAIAVAGALGYFPVSAHLDAKAKDETFRARFNVAFAKFQKLCETAGDKIYKTVENVEGIRLTKVFDKEMRTTDPSWDAAAFSRGVGSRSSYIAKFLWYEELREPPNPSWRGTLTSVPSPIPGYRFVEVGPIDGNKVDRYVLQLHEVQKTLQAVVELDASPKAIYGVAVEDLPEARDLTDWIAGGRIQIINLKTNEVMAEHRRFAFDRALGSTAGHRQQWLFADACPEPKIKPFEVRFFVDQVLKPVQESSK